MAGNQYCCHRMLESIASGTVEFDGEAYFINARFEYTFVQNAGITGALEPISREITYCPYCGKFISKEKENDTGKG